MIYSKIEPKDKEIILCENDLIVSKTNARGIIQYANADFCRISGFEEHELLGKPHNIVRHPDIPKCVYYALWEALKRDDTFTFYLKNMSKSGEYYWVESCIETVNCINSGEHTGFHSTRKTFDRGFIPIIENIYKRLKMVEESYNDTSQGMLIAYNIMINLVSDGAFPIYKIRNNEMSVAVF